MLNEMKLRFADKLKQVGLPPSEFEAKLREVTLADMQHFCCTEDRSDHAAFLSHRTGLDELIVAGAQSALVQIMWLSFGVYLCLVWQCPLNHFFKHV